MIDKFGELFRKWNASINLSTGDLDEQITDSQAVIPHLAAATRVLDVGSGGGFPVVIAALALPAVAFTSLEPVHKKHAFLKTAARELGLANLTALAIRLEDHDLFDYDAAMSRATFDLRDWLNMAIDRVKPGGIAIGFEAVQRTDLPENTVRHPYRLADKTRAIVTLQRR